ncbi:hypothetical protein I587_02273 [Enterococcus mundtii ATCC 882]|nr:hypothetical protein UAC_00424 [Enterococcus mundtii ATCC 882]EOU13719.1 hypothetical protein I587_02273 [Enterococcus mundtii ATCC 882]PJK26485.1 hypothetical protein CV769_03875 [Enterococcus mundtii]
MNMICKKQLKQFLKRKFKSKDCFKLKVLTFKKDRYLLISYDQERYTIVEEGFEKSKYEFDSSDEAIKAVMKMANIEFKRSYRLHVQ